MQPLDVGSSCATSRLSRRGHLLGGFFSYKGCFADFNTSLYFSMITYTTVGYGDVVLRDKERRLLSGVEALTGSLMLCWSTVILSRSSPRSTGSVERFGKRKSRSRANVFIIPIAGDDVFPSSVRRRVVVIDLPQSLVASDWWAKKGICGSRY